MNDIPGRKQPHVLPQCYDSHVDLAERFRVYYPEKITKIRSTTYHRIIVTPNHRCRKFITITTTFVLCHHSHSQPLVLSFDL